MAAGGSTKAVLAALIGNSLIAIAKFVAFLVTGSSSMLAESIHSAADSGNQGLLLWGGKSASKAADEEHQFGYGRERYFWSFVVALVLFSLGGGFATYEGILKIRNPHEIDNLGVALGVLVFAIVIEGFTFRTAVVASKAVKGDLTWWQFIRRSRSPELPVVLLEDLGAMVGLVLAFVALIVAEVADAPIWDGIGTLAIGILLLSIAAILIVEMRSLLLGEGARPREMVKIRAAIISAPHVQKLIHLRTQHLGPQELLIGAKIVFDSDLSMAELADAINGVEAAVRAQVPYARPMYIEPDLHRDPAEMVADNLPVAPH